MATACRCFVLFLLLLVSSVVNAAQGSIAVRDLPGVTVGGAIYVSDDGSLTRPDRNAMGWEPLRQPLGNGFKAQTYWIELRVTAAHDDLGKTVVLRFQPPNARDVMFYLPDGQVYAQGSQSSFDQRVLGFPDIAAAFKVSQTPTIVYVRLATSGRVFGSFELMSQKAYYQSLVWRSAVHGVFYGMLVLLVLVNLLNWYSSRQPIYGIYLCFVLFASVASLTVNGYLHAYFIGDWYRYHPVIQLWSVMGMVSVAIMFATRILRLDQLSKTLSTLADWLAAALLFLMLPVSLLPLTRPYVWELMFAVTLLYGATSLMTSAYNARVERSTTSYLLLTGYLSFFIGLAISVTTVLGGLPATPLNVNMWQVGLVFHLILLQMALIVKNNEIRRLGWREQGKLEVLRMQAEHEARRNRDLQSFLERLTHEFKTPLAVIDSSVQSLSMFDCSPAQKDVRYERIRRAVGRLNDLMVQSMIAEKVNWIKDSGELEIFDLPALLEAVIGDFTSKEINVASDVSVQIETTGKASPTNVRIQWIGIAQPQRLMLQGKVGWLQASIHHVLDNALKYGLPERDVLLQVHFARSSDGASVVEIDITNECDVLLNEAELPRLFEKYYRRGEQTNVSGVGLGLAIARAMIEEHHGTVSVRLKPHSQIVFQICLPLINKD